MFHILEIDAGWITGEIGDNLTTHFFDYSYLTNFLEDIMKSLLYIHGDDNKEEYGNEFIAEWEPAVDKWKMSLNDTRLIVNIKNYEDSDTSELREDKTLEFDYYEFLGEVSTAMKEILNKYGLTGYKDSWGMEFPVSLYLQLLNVLDNDKENTDWRKL